MALRTAGADHESRPSFSITGQCCAIASGSSATSGRRHVQDVPDRYANMNAESPNNWNYERTTASRFGARTRRNSGATRLTWQATPRNKLGFYIDYTRTAPARQSSADGGQCRAPGDGWTAAGPRNRSGRGHELTRIRNDSRRPLEDHAGHLQAPLSNRSSSKAGSRRSGRSGATSGRPARAVIRSRSPSRRRGEYAVSDAVHQLHLPRLAGAGRDDSAERELPWVAVVRHRLAQYEGRLPGRLHDREDADVRRTADSATASAMGCRTN